MEVIPPQRNCHVPDPPTYNGVNVIVHLAGGHLVPHSIQGAIGKHYSPCFCCRNVDRLQVLTDTAHVGLVALTVGHPPDVCGGEVMVVYGEVHLRAHVTHLVSIFFLPKLLCQPCLLCRVEFLWVYKDPALP